MRPIDWNGPLSEEDVAFLRQMGVVGMEERIQGHQARFSADVPSTETPADTVTTSALDVTGGAATPANTGDGPKRIDPTQEDPPQVDDDYDSWKVAELETEVTARNEMPDTSQVTVVGSGKDGKVLKSDLIDGLRAWDRENPDAIS
jgi:hypothetical protein